MRIPTPLLTATLMGLLCASIAAQAQTVQLNGVIDLYAGERQLSGRAKIKTADSGGMTTSRWGFEGSEDLGGGIKAQFNLSGFLRADTGEAGRFGSADGGWRRFAYVGVQSKDLGTLRLGRLGTPTFGVAIRFNPFADSTALAPYVLHMYPGGQPLAAPMNAPDSAADNSVAWLSPTWSGFNVTGLYSLGETTTSSNKRWALGANWSAGPVSVGLAAEQSKVPAGLPTGVTKLANVQAGVSYDLQVLKLFGQYGTTALSIASGKRDYATWQLGTAVPVGSGNILLSYASSKKTEPVLADVKRGTLGVGYDHNLSKRTDLYAVYLSDKVKGLSTGNSLVAGVRHRF
jgi:predicted porin